MANIRQWECVTGIAFQKKNRGGTIAINGGIGQKSEGSLPVRSWKKEVA